MSCPEASAEQQKAVYGNNGTGNHRRVPSVQMTNKEQLLVVQLGVKQQPEEKDRWQIGDKGAKTSIPGTEGRRRRSGSWGRRSDSTTARRRDSAWMAGLGVYATQLSMAGSQRRSRRTSASSVSYTPARQQRTRFKVTSVKGRACAIACLQRKGAMLGAR